MPERPERRCAGCTVDARTQARIDPGAAAMPGAGDQVDPDIRRQLALAASSRVGMAPFCQSSVELVGCRRRDYHAVEDAPPASVVVHTELEKWRRNRQVCEARKATNGSRDP